MKRKIDPRLAEVLRKYGADPDADIWDCHGTWVAYHRTCERIAAQAGITFTPPTVIEGRATEGVVTVLVTGSMDGRSEWSFGEASPKNNKNAYPYAMAEKRAKDRVILKLVGLAGVYSEEEADEFKEKARPPQASTGGAGASGTGDPTDDVLTKLSESLFKVPSEAALTEWWEQTKEDRKKLPLADFETLKQKVSARRRTLSNAAPQPQSTLMAG